MTATYPDAYALRPEPIQARLYSEENRSGEPSRLAPAEPAEPAVRETARPFLTCPDCEREGHPGRIGSRRNYCPLCNRFASAARASFRRRLLALLTPEEQDRMRGDAEAEVYARMVTEEVAR